MTEKEMKKLSRADLLELLVIQVRENERLTALLQEAEEKLQARDVVVNEAGSLADAAMQLSGVFENAQTAASLYLDNIEAVNKRQAEICAEKEQECFDRCQRLIKETRTRCSRYEEKTRERCLEMLRDTVKDLKRR